MWHKALVRLELTRVGFLVKLVNHYTTKGDPILFVIIQFSISYLFALSLNVKQFYLINR